MVSEIEEAAKLKYYRDGEVWSYDEHKLETFEAALHLYLTAEKGDPGEERSLSAFLDQHRYWLARAKGELGICVLVVLSSIRENRKGGQTGELQRRSTEAYEALSDEFGLIVLCAAYDCFLVQSGRMSIDDFADQIDEWLPLGQENVTSRSTEFADETMALLKRYDPITAWTAR